MNNNLIVETFTDKTSAEKAFNTALELGYKSEDISIMMSKETQHTFYEKDPHAEEDALKGLTLGGVLGGSIGGSIGALIALGTNIVLPGVGLVIAGPLVGAGGVYGSLLGTLIGWGTPNNPPNAYEENIKRGEIILLAEEQPHKGNLKDAWKSMKELH